MSMAVNLTRVDTALLRFFSRGATTFCYMGYCQQFAAKIKKQIKCKNMKMLQPKFLLTSNKIKVRKILGLKIISIHKNIILNL